MTYNVIDGTEDAKAERIVARVGRQLRTEPIGTRTIARLADLSYETTLAALNVLLYRSRVKRTESTLGAYPDGNYLWSRPSR